MESWVKEDLIEAMKNMELVDLKAKTAEGDKIDIKKDKHGFFKIKITSEEDIKV